jgi:glycosyltransferase involved in cell wall biosynthesis
MKKYMTLKEERILIIITLFSIGGATETVVSLAAGLKKRGYSVDIVTGPPLKNEGDMFAEAKRLGLNVIVLNDLVRDINVVSDMKAMIALMAIIRRGHYSIVHTHSSKAGVLGRLSGWLSKTPVIVHTIHGLPYHNFQARALAKSYILIEKLCALISSKIISVTHAIVKNCVANGIAREDKFTVIRSGLQLDYYANDGSKRGGLRQRYGFTDSDVVAGVISRIAPLKGHEYIVDLAGKTKKSYPRIKYLIVGDGETGENMRAEITAKGLEKFVVFTGMVNPEEIPNMISATDFIIHPSLREGLARVLPQSIIMNKKVITFNLDGVDEVIEDGVSGFAIETGDKERLYQACIDVCESDAYKNIEPSFRKKVELEFSSDTMVQRHIELYERMLPQ